MKIKYLVYVRRGDSDGESEETFEVFDEGVDELQTVLRHAVRDLGIAAHDRDCCLGEFWVSSYPAENRAFFEQGIEEYYTLSFPGMPVRNRQRVNRLMAATR